MNAALLILALAGVSCRAEKASPISKVVQLLSDLEAKVIAEGESSHKTFAEFSAWCEDRSSNLNFQIKTGKGEVAKLNAVIDQQSALIGSGEAKVEELAAQIATDEADLKAARHIREKEATDFAAEEKELTGVVDMLGRATSILAREMKGGAAMVQLSKAKTVVQALDTLVQASVMSTADASGLAALVQNSADDADAGAPDAAVYESHSGGILETMQGLQDKAEDQLSKLRKAEMSSKHNFELLEQSLEDSVKFANADMRKVKKAVAESGETKSTAEGDLAVTSKDLKADENQLGDLHRDCMVKAETFEEEKKSREEELKALAEAKKVINDSTAGATKLSYGLNQMSFLQRVSMSTSSDLSRFEAVRLVRDLARKQQSAILAQLASRMETVMRTGAADPFTKIKGLISNMISRLEDEAGADATEKSYCDKELKETNQKKTDKSDEISKRSTKIDQMSSQSALLKDQTAALQDALAKLAAAQAEMDKLRSDEHSAFVSNKADMEQGVQGVKTALRILRDYYASETAHAEAAGAGNGIIGLLEVCESDFSRGLAEMVAAEEAAAQSYERATKENEIEKTTKEQDTKYKAQESASLDKAVSEASSDRAGVQAELDAVLEYLAKMNERCVAKAGTYAERARRRQAEIDGLKDALQILDSETA
jgi:hypothetical protein